MKQIDMGRGFIRQQLAIQEEAQITYELDIIIYTFVARNLVVSQEGVAEIFKQLEVGNR